jgi:cyclase
MYRKRVIPCLLISGNGVVKTKKFKSPVYIGDPINIVRIFSEKEVDELFVLDIDATVQNREPNYELISEIAGECFMPLAYGGGVKSLDQVKKLIRSGIEKVVINSEAYSSKRVISQAVEIFGSQAVVGGVDVKKGLFGDYRAVSHSGSNEINIPLDGHIMKLEELGVGELLVNSIDRDGMMTGYDLSLIARISKLVDVPMVICGGAGSISDFSSAINAGASAVAAGSIFVFYGKHQAVLINYPNISL